ncbi:hypothetical protein BamMEX5DRAFT_1005 [Burkholderia ambifaria MEX-5]|uniref:Uncharacterized protein n=1 Tax=Burkholderia ambifaria MEX-5 TaxID=396597 RepID=B1SZN9_9BURK|nr:hypothetical protein BamMEX5DRAFT_1005 [Burkholderia ambifaria MEX-5]
MMDATTARVSHPTPAPHTASIVRIGSVLARRHCIGDISYRPRNARLNAASDG